VDMDPTMEPDQHEFGVVVKFTDETPSFVHGYECGYIACELLHITGDTYERALPVHFENQETLRRIAKWRGFTVEFRDAGTPPWVYATFTRGSPKLTLIKG
jgi:hypothetical protein